MPERIQDVLLALAFLACGGHHILLRLLSLHLCNEYLSLQKKKKKKKKKTVKPKPVSQLVKHACFCPPTKHDTKLDQLNKAKEKQALSRQSPR